MGTAALQNNTVSNNTAAGCFALQGNTTGANNTAVGHSALKANNTAANNVAVGVNAALVITTGASNTAVGTSALSAATSGSTNTALGVNAGSGITTGASNLLLGVAAGANITTGGGNIMLSNCDGAAVGTSHQIVMGASVTGVGQDNFTFGRGTSDSNIAFGATSITAPSDQRYKEDIADATAGLAFIKDLRPVTFRWKKEKDVPSDHPAYVEGSDTRVMNNYTNHGFIAQEVKTAIDAHSEIKDGFDMWSEQGAGGRQRLGPSSLIPILVKAMQEQNALIEALTARITTLEG